MPTNSLILESYVDGRQAVLRDTEELGVEILDWTGVCRPGQAIEQDRQKRITIGSQLIHIAGFDSMVRAAVLGVDLTELTTGSDWLGRYGAGFPRELALEPPIGQPIGYYHDVLHEEAELTEAVIKGIGSDALWLDGFTDFYNDGQEFEVGALRPHRNARLLMDIPLHDRYHRGQISQTRYDYRQLLMPIVTG